MIRVLFEDNHLLVVDKPPGIATMGAQAGTTSVYSWAANYLKQKYNKPGRAYVGIVSRLDRDVSGVLTLARTSKAAARLSDQIRRQVAVKRYLARVQTSRLPTRLQDWTTFEDWLRKNDRLHRMEVVAGPGGGAQHAVLQVRSLVCDPGLTIVEVNLVTGRKHQIRAQLAAHGMPLVGDPKYGRSAGKRRFRAGMPIRLHCHRVEIEHPTQKIPLTFHSLPTAWWPEVPQRVWTMLAERLQHGEPPQGA